MPEISKDGNLRIIGKQRNHCGWKSSLLMFIFFWVKSICVTFFFNGKNQMTFSCWCDNCPVTPQLCSGVSTAQRERCSKRTVLKGCNRALCCFGSLAPRALSDKTQTVRILQHNRATIYMLSCFALLFWRSNPGPGRYQASPQPPATPQKHFMKRQVPWRQSPVIPRFRKIRSSRPSAWRPLLWAILDYMRFCPKNQQTTNT